jgi:hypothetical protein
MFREVRHTFEKVRYEFKNPLDEIEKVRHEFENSFENSLGVLDLP